MNDEVSGSVLSLYKSRDGYEVRVELKTTRAGAITLDIATGRDNPNDAIEATRSALYEMGVAMAKAFDTQGSLT